MRKMFALLPFAFSCVIGCASAQEAPVAGHGLRAGSIRASGQTVPDPATLPNAQRSSVDRPIKSEDRGKTDFGICKNC